MQERGWDRVEEIRAACPALEGLRDNVVMVGEVSVAIAACVDSGSIGVSARRRGVESVSAAFRLQAAPPVS